MCGHCGCDVVDAIGELRDEHRRWSAGVHGRREDLVTFTASVVTLEAVAWRPWNAPMPTIRPS